MHVGLNLIYLVPGETGGMEVYARELIPELVAAAPGARFTVFVNRETASDRHDPVVEVVDRDHPPEAPPNRGGTAQAVQQVDAGAGRQSG